MRFRFGRLRKVILTSVITAGCGGNEPSPLAVESDLIPLCGDDGGIQEGTAGSGGSAGSDGIGGEGGGTEPPPAPSFDCSVSLAKLSYDSPGSDRAEFIELRIAGRTTDQGIRATLGDCGIDHLELINGGSTCSVYRTIPLFEVPVPADGALILCAEESIVFADLACDVVGWGRSVLRDGWLQNGPSDGLRLVGTEAVGTIRSFAYEGVPASCSDPSWVSLPEDDGGVTQEADPVVVACPDGFTVLPYAELRRGESPDCAPVLGDAGISGEEGMPESPPGPGAEPESGGDSDSSSGPQSGIGSENGTVKTTFLDVYAPPVSAHPEEAAATPPIFRDYGADAGLTPPEFGQGCRIAEPGRTTPAFPPWLALLYLSLLAFGGRARASGACRQRLTRPEC